MKRIKDLRVARTSLAALVMVSVVMVKYVGAPILPVTIGSVLASVWLLWRAAEQH